MIFNTSSPMSTPVAVSNGGTSAVNATDARSNLGAAPNNNLLDNPDFSINQRGKTEYSGGGMTVSRWRALANLKVNVNDDGSVKVANISGTTTGISFYQVLLLEESKQLYGKEVTFSIKMSNGSIYSATATIPTTPPAASRNLADKYVIAGALKLQIIEYANGTVAVNIVPLSGSHDVASAKFEIGSVSTLVDGMHFNYRDAMLKCSYFYRRIVANSSYGSFGIGTCLTGGTVFIDVPRMPMRLARPTVSYSGAFQLVGQSGDEHDVEDMELDQSSDTLMRLKVTATGTQAGKIYRLRAKNDALAYIDESADL